MSSKGNKRAKQRLIELYGAECFIDKLHLRDDKKRTYTGKKQYERMKQLTYHHIKERRNGGQATVENGAILSVENHEWFNKQAPEKQAELNKSFQEYKKRMDNARECKIEFVDTLDIGIKINYTEISFSEEIKPPKEKFNRAKVKEETRNKIKEWEDER